MKTKRPKRPTGEVRGRAVGFYGKVFDMVVDHPLIGFHEYECDTVETDHRVDKLMLSQVCQRDHLAPRAPECICAI